MIFVYIPVSFYGIGSLFLGRIYSAVLLMAAYLLIDIFFIKPKYGNKYHYIFLLLFFLNSFLINWTTVIKLYSLSILLLTAALVFFYRFIINPYKPKKNVFFCFLSLSLLSLTRIVFIINLLIFLSAFVFFLLKQKSGKLQLINICLSGMIIPYIYPVIVYFNHFQIVYDNIVTANTILREKFDNLIPGYFEMTAFFFLPQNLMLLIIAFTIRRFDFFEKVILVNILLFFIVHLNTLMYAEYLTPVLPLMFILAIRKWDGFLEKSRIIRRYTVKMKIKLIIIAYIVFIPLGITYLKHPFEGGKFMFNPLQLKSLLSEVNTIKGTYILSGWEGYSVYSDKVPLAPDQYQSFYLNDLYSSVPSELEKMMLTGKDYRELIRSGKPDIIVYEPDNPVHLKGMKDDIELLYAPDFEKGGVIIYHKK
jgi:hypothetical protein